MSDPCADKATRPYADLTPETIIAAAAAVALAPTGGLQALNSYENRVYKVATETVPWAIKFYRPASRATATSAGRNRRSLSR